MHLADVKIFLRHSSHLLLLSALSRELQLAACDYDLSAQPQSLWCHVARMQWLGIFAQQRFQQRFLFRKLPALYKCVGSLVYNRCWCCLVANEKDCVPSCLTSYLQSATLCMASCSQTLRRSPQLHYAQSVMCEHTDDRCIVHADVYAPIYADIS